MISSVTVMTEAPSNAEYLKSQYEILYLEKESLKNALEEDEFLVDDLIGANAYNQNDELIGIVDCINKQGFSDLLSIKNKLIIKFFSE